MESETQHKTWHFIIGEMPILLEEFKSYTYLGDLLQPGTPQTPQVSTTTPVLQAGYSGFDPNDLQGCCKPSKIIIVTPDNMEHDWKCPVAEKHYNKRYASNLPSEPFDGCEHEYIKYTGLQETFEFCRKCDKKRA